MRKGSVLLVVAAFGTGALVALTVFGIGSAGRSPVIDASQAVWSEVAWPFPIDPWGKGKAFRCKAADCGAELNVYLRAKIGFCNCSTGVSDDEELSRISDLDLFRSPPSPLADGRAISVAWMKGRSRPFSVQGEKAVRSVLSVGFNDRCDAIIATAVSRHDQPLDFEPAVIEFLNSRTSEPRGRA